MDFSLTLFVWYIYIKFLCKRFLKLRLRNFLTLSIRRKKMVNGEFSRIISRTEPGLKSWKERNIWRRVWLLSFCELYPGIVIYDIWTIFEQKQKWLNSIHWSIVIKSHWNWIELDVFSKFPYIPIRNTGYLTKL